MDDVADSAFVQADRKVCGVQAFHVLDKFKTCLKIEAINI